MSRATIRTASASSPSPRSAIRCSSRNPSSALLGCRTAPSPGRSRCSLTTSPRSDSCSCWTTASTFSMRRPSWPARSCAHARTSGSSRPAVRLSASPARSSSRCRPFRCRIADDASAADALRSDAVSLFVERATASRPGFSVDAENVAAVLELCRRLDGVPLALELAAVRLNALGLDALVKGLRDRLDLLGTGDRSQPRQQTLDATIDWSYQLLTEPERLLWSRLSVFAGGFELDAAEQVCADDVAAGRARSRSFWAASSRSRSSSSASRAAASGFASSRSFASSGRNVCARRDPSERSTSATRNGSRSSRPGSPQMTTGSSKRLARVRAEQSNVWAALDFCLEDEAEIDRGIAHLPRSLHLLARGRPFLAGDRRSRRLP